MQGTTSVDVNNNNIFADLDRRVNIVATTEPSVYISADPDYSGASTDPIKFWSDKCGDSFAHFALDFVSAPGNVLALQYLHSLLTFSLFGTATSVDVE